MDHFLYFVGAGLTKSLQTPGRPVPMMNDFVSVMADYVEDNVILTTLAQWEVLPDPPYGYRPQGIVDLARPLADATDRSPERRAAFRRALKNRPAESIEELLASALTKRPGPFPGMVPTRFRYGINRVFRIIGWDLNLSPLLLFLQNRLALAGTHTFVSFNYDLVLDYAISRVLRRPALGALYGLDKINPDPKVKLIKPHGSLNFIGNLRIPYTHTKYGLAFEEGRPQIPGMDSGEVRYWTDTTEVEEPCIVPPVASKPEALKELGLSFLEELREAERQAIELADAVYVIGWSIPETDDDQMDLIRKSVPGKLLRKLVVVNLAARLCYFSRVADLLGVTIDKMILHNAGFCEFVESTIR